MKRTRLGAVALMAAAALTFAGCNPVVGGRNEAVTPIPSPQPTPAPDAGGDPDVTGEEKFVQGGDGDARNDPGVMYYWADQWWCGSGVNVTSVSSTDGAYTVNYDVYENSNCTFGLQFFKYDMLEEGKTYISSFTVVSNVDKNVTVNGTAYALLANEEVVCSSIKTGNGAIPSISIQAEAIGAQEGNSFTVKDVVLKEIDPADLSVKGIKATVKNSTIKQSEITTVDVVTEEEITVDGKVYTINRNADPANVVLSSDSDAVSFDKNTITGIKAADAVVVKVTYGEYEDEVTVSVEATEAIQGPIVIFSTTDEANAVVTDYAQNWWNGYSVSDVSFAGKDNVKAMEFPTVAGACGAWTMDVSFAPSEGKKVQLQVTLYSEKDGAIKPVSPDKEYAFTGMADWQTLTVDYEGYAELKQLGFIDKVGGNTIYVCDVRIVEVEK